MTDKVYTDTEICLKCVDKNEVLYDDEETFVKRLKSSQIQCPDTLNSELLKNLEVSKDLLLMFIKQRMIMNEPRVRFDPINDVAGMQAKISDANVSKDTKTFLMDMSKVGYRCLKEENMLDDFVEFDGSRHTRIIAFGQKIKMTAYFDILSLVDEAKIKNKIAKEKVSKDEAKGKKRMEKHRRENESKNPDPGKEVENSDSGMSEKHNGGDSLSTSDTAVSSSCSGRAAISVIVTARNYLSVVDIYRQLLFSYAHTLSRFYFLVLHTGPLVENQEMVLYEYRPSKPLVELIKSFDRSALDEQNKTTATSKTDVDEFIVSQTVHKTSSMSPPDQSEIVSASHDLDVNQLEESFRKIMGRRLQKVAELKDYFKYLVHDCPGVKDNEKDKKDRYERYMEKRAKKKEQKNKQRKEREQEKSLDSKNAEVGSEGLSGRTENFEFM